MRVSAKREGCSEAIPLGDAGWEREARAKARRAVGAGGAKPQEAVLFFFFGRVGPAGAELSTGRELYRVFIGTYRVHTGGADSLVISNTYDGFV